MLIVISSPDSIVNETTLINQLFDEGLKIFHLRKPESSEDEINKLMMNINSEHYSKIVFHQHLHLAKNLGLNRIHLTEFNRLNLNETEILDLKKDFEYLSTSIHFYQDFENLSGIFDYAFLGPVFDSISKKEYKAKDLQIELKMDQNHSTKIIALGGITQFNMNEPLSSGFDGVAVLGSIWENKNPIEEFKQINNGFKKCEITF